MKIILLGYMASGKSTVGKQLSESMLLPFIDLDEYIENQENSTIKAIFKEKGEVYFRKIEHYYLNQLLDSDDDFILSLGGGTPCYANNMESIQKAKALSFYLQASIATLSNRLINAKTNRPLVANLSDDAIAEFVAKHLFERNLYYKKATFTITIDDKSISEVVSDVENHLN